MEKQAPIIGNQNPIKPGNDRIATPNLDEPLKSNSHSDHSPAFLNGVTVFSQLEISDIEMIAMQTLSYTSLKDLLPASTPAIMSPTNNSSWTEVSIKNPLVKHAALAYLQPMSSPPAVGKGCFSKFKERCFGAEGECGCLRWFTDVVLRAVRAVSRRRREETDEDEEDDYSHDYEKAD